MITLEVLLRGFPALPAADVQGWIRAGHIRAEPGPVFTEFDVERVRLIVELRDIFEVNDVALPLVLSLLDQMYELRRRLTAG